MPNRSARKRKLDSESYLLAKIRRLERKILVGKRKISSSDSSDSGSDCLNTPRRHAMPSSGDELTDVSRSRSRSRSPVIHHPRARRPRVSRGDVERLSSSSRARSKHAREHSTSPHERHSSTSERAGPPPKDITLAGNQASNKSQISEDVLLKAQPSTSTNVASPSMPSINLEPSEAPNEVVEEILQLLGDDPSVKKVYGKDIQKDLAVRLEYIATNGLTSDLRKELKDRYLIPANSPLIDAPAMNPEIKGVVSDTVAKRLKAIELKQKQTATAIACLGEAITAILAQKEKDSVIVKLLMDACRILCDSQYNDSITRRNFIISLIKSDMRDQLKGTKIDGLLFGQDLSETVKAAKAINRSGVDLKVSATKRPQAKKPELTKTPSSGALNWKPSSSNRRPPRNQRRNPPASKTQHSSSSKTSRSSRRQYRK